MGVEHGTMISRTDITKQLNTYIKQQSLENPTNRQQIIPDEKLFSILSEGARSVVITHFNIQKYINHNFQVKKPAQEPVSVTDAQTTA
jgi:chromatin remodeling complex protein RSC6